MKHVYTARDPIDAHLVRDLLQAEGIPPRCAGRCRSARGEIPMTEDTLPSVWVPDERAAARARSIVHTHQERARRCGEELEPQFSACWRCGPDLA
ncbi:MAG: putative signal transducing protein [Gammaproteobacteria bacterium]